MSFISAIGGDIKKVFGWLVSTKGQAIITAGEGAVEDVWPAATGLINIVNKWMAKAITVEGVAEAAGQASGTGAQKSAIAIADLTPVILADAKSAGLPTPDATKIQQVNDAVVNIINLLTGKTTTPPAA
jgi:hypothetical protein